MASKATPLSVFGKLLEERIRGKAFFVVVFGSYVKGKMTKLSDLDIGVYPRSRDLDERLMLSFEIVRSASEAFSVPEDKVDVVFLDGELPIELLFNAVCRGELTYLEDKDFYSDFRDRIISEYLDFQVFKRKLKLCETYAKALEKRIREWGK